MKLFKSNLLLKKLPSQVSNRQLILKIRISIMKILELKDSTKEIPLKMLRLKLAELPSTISNLEFKIKM
jgi:hypothetical protein